MPQARVVAFEFAGVGDLPSRHVAALSRPPLMNGHLQSDYTR